MNWMVAFKLGRVSNLPTVWTNVWAGAILAGGSILEPLTIWLLVAISLFYVGGMYLNDAFDANIDAVERPERPIPAGQVSRRLVFGFGYGMLFVGLGILTGVGLVPDQGTGIWPAIGGIGLAGAVILYNWTHKQSPISPALMGICRALVYVAVGLCLAVPLPTPVLVGAGLLLSYLIGLTYVAKHENFGANQESLAIGISSCSHRVRSGLDHRPSGNSPLLGSFLGMDAGLPFFSSGDAMLATSLAR